MLRRPSRGWRNSRESLPTRWRRSRPSFWGVYPEPDDRRKLNDAFETLHQLLRSPGRLRSLLSVALSAFWRLGKKLPAAAQAGRLTLDTFEKVRRVEEGVARAFQDADIPPRARPDDKKLSAVLAPLPKQPFLDLADALTALLRALSDESVLQAGLELTRTLEAATAKSPANWTAQERDGLRLARETLEEATALFSLLPPDRRPNLIRESRGSKMPGPKAYPKNYSFPASRSAPTTTTSSSSWQGVRR